MELKLADELKDDKYIKEFINNYKIIVAKDARYLLSYTNLQSNTIICFDDKKDNVMVNINDVLYFESFNGDVYVKIKGKILKVKKKLFELEEQYNKHGFIRINKSQILNIYHVNKITGSFSRKFTLYLDNNEELEVNRAYYTKFKERLEI